MIERSDAGRIGELSSLPSLPQWPRDPDGPGAAALGELEKLAHVGATLAVHDGPIWTAHHITGVRFAHVGKTRFLGNGRVTIFGDDVTFAHVGKCRDPSWRGRATRWTTSNVNRPAPKAVTTSRPRSYGASVWSWHQRQSVIGWSRSTYSFTQCDRFIWVDNGLLRGPGPIAVSGQTSIRCRPGARYVLGRQRPRELLRRGL